MYMLNVHVNTISLMVVKTKIQDIDFKFGMLRRLKRKVDGSRMFKHNQNRADCAGVEGLLIIITITLFVKHLSKRGYKVLPTNVHGKNEESIVIKDILVSLIQEPNHNIIRLRPKDCLETTQQYPTIRTHNPFTLLLRSCMKVIHWVTIKRNKTNQLSWKCDRLLW